MAASALTSGIPGDSDWDGIEPVTSRHDLTDAQIEELLHRATLRIQNDPSLSALKGSNDTTRFRLPKLDAGDGEQPLLGAEEQPQPQIAAPSKQDSSIGIRKVEDPVLAKALAKQKKSMTAGSKWFDLPKTKLTPELKRDLQLLKMRNVLDPHRHYKKENGKMGVPEYSQVGTIVEGATEFYSGRIENKKRKRTFVEEVLAGEQETGRFKRKYGEVQARKGSGKKAFYKGVQSKRKQGVKKGG